jgi:hypothetical protein
MLREITRQANEVVDDLSSPLSAVRFSNSLDQASVYEYSHGALVNSAAKAASNEASRRPLPHHPKTGIGQPGC